MITQFPSFEPISVKSKKDIDRIVGKFPPYSDFNFVSMYSWNVKNKMLISHLDGNLVVQFDDYMTGDSFLSFIGDKNVDKTAMDLINYGVAKGLPPTLHLIPEHVVSLIERPAHFIIKEDRDAHDYVVLAIKYRQLRGKNYASKRHGVHKFMTANSSRAQIKKLDIDNTVAREIIDTFHEWRKQTNRSIEETENELRAVERLTKDARHFSLNTLGIYIDDVMVAFSIYEIQGTYAMGHFEKALKSHTGLYDFLKHSTAVDLHKQGVEYINYEQDLGIESLRQSKLLLHPETFLKKYTISLPDKK